jgi:hypothetical protein
VLPSEERQGLTGSATHWRTLLVFRRAIAEDAPIAATPLRAEPVLAKPPAAAKSQIESKVEPEFEEGAEETRPA